MYKIENLSRLFIHNLLWVSIGILFAGCEQEKEEDRNVAPVEVQAGITFKSTGSLSLHLSHYFKEESLRFSPDSFVTKANDTIQITELKYYISHVTLIHANGSQWDAGNFNLINAQNVEDISINGIPAGNYTGMTFLLGVDSLNNHTLNHDEPALDPNLGMSWSWSTGYIFIRVKGTHGIAKSGFSFDLGGDQHLLKLSYDFKPYKLSKDSYRIGIKTDVNEFFENPNTYNLKTQSNAIHTPVDAEIPLFTANIANGMFTLKSLE